MLIHLLFNIVNFGSKFSSDLNEKWHNMFHKVGSPSKFHRHIRFDEVIASIKADSEKFLFSLCHEKPQEILYQIGFLGLLRCFNAISVHLILFGQVY